ncbi:hypothetical protein BESB_021410 [Besnoitia besnoiti]|uniref:Uncharacterized protein n=1 Tax=Besnoitia besnoiti TaxID=94643 RepID=A0A2A9MA00_BESBE|nr:hypothetical protein BESB_021410 [Besnoitia besnoiti]PFH32200.1 hypothetical protein BESB_021410 [Besnoitia besnoiti]
MDRERAGFNADSWLLRIVNFDSLSYRDLIVPWWIIDPVDDRRPLTCCIRCVVCLAFPDDARKSPVEGACAQAEAPPPAQGPSYVAAGERAGGSAASERGGEADDLMKDGRTTQSLTYLLSQRNDASTTCGRTSSANEFTAVYRRQVIYCGSRAIEEQKQARHSGSRYYVQPNCLHSPCSKGAPRDVEPAELPAKREHTPQDLAQKAEPQSGMSARDTYNESRRGSWMETLRGRCTLSTPGKKAERHKKQDSEPGTGRVLTVYVGATDYSNSHAHVEFLAAIAHRREILRKQHQLVLEKVNGLAGAAGGSGRERDLRKQTTPEQAATMDSIHHGKHNDAFTPSGSCYQEQSVLTCWQARQAALEWMISSYSILPAHIIRDAETADYRVRSEGISPCNKLLPSLFALCVDSLNRMLFATLPSILEFQRSTTNGQLLCSLVCWSRARPPPRVALTFLLVSSSAEHSKQHAPTNNVVLQQSLTKAEISGIEPCMHTSLQPRESTGAATMDASAHSEDRSLPEKIWDKSEGPDYCPSDFRQRFPFVDMVLHRVFDVEDLYPLLPFIPEDVIAAVLCSRTLNRTDTEYRLTGLLSSWRRIRESKGRRFRSTAHYGHASGRRIRPQAARENSTSIAAGISCANGVGALAAGCGAFRRGPRYQASDNLGAPPGSCFVYCPDKRLLTYFSPGEILVWLHKRWRLVFVRLTRMQLKNGKGGYANEKRIDDCTSIESVHNGNSAPSATAHDEAVFSESFARSAHAVGSQPRPGEPCVLSEVTGGIVADRVLEVGTEGMTSGYASTSPDGRDRERAGEVVSSIGAGSHADVVRVGVHREDSIALDETAASGIPQIEERLQVVSTPVPADLPSVNWQHASPSRTFQVADLGSSADRSRMPTGSEGSGCMQAASQTGIDEEEEVANELPGSESPVSLGDLSHISLTDLPDLSPTWPDLHPAAVSRKPRTQRRLVNRLVYAPCRRWREVVGSGPQYARPEQQVRTFI